MSGRSAEESAAIEDAVDNRPRAVRAVHGDITPNKLVIAPCTAGEPDSRKSDFGGLGVIVMKFAYHVLYVDQVITVGIGGTF